MQEKSGKTKTKTFTINKGLVLNSTNKKIVLTEKAKEIFQESKKERNALEKEKEIKKNNDLSNYYILNVLKKKLKIIEKDEKEKGKDKDKERSKSKNSSTPSYLKSILTSNMNSFHSDSSGSLTEDYDYNKIVSIPLKWLSSSSSSSNSSLSSAGENKRGKMKKNTKKSNFSYSFKTKSSEINKKKQRKDLRKDNDLSSNLKKIIEKCYEEEELYWKNEREKKLKKDKAVLYKNFKSKSKIKDYK